MVTVTDALSLIYTTINADATLQGASYLTSSGRIFQSFSRPLHFVNPAITMRAIPVESSGQQFALDKWLLWINLYLNNFGNMLPDSARAGSIEARIATLLDHQILNSAAIDKMMIDRYNVADILVDEEAPHETVWRFQYFIEAIT